MATLTPLQFAENYWNMKVYFDDGPIQVRIFNYVNGVHSCPVKVTSLFDEECETFSATIKSVHGPLATKTYYKAIRKELEGVIKDPYYGQGSPEEVQVLLQAMVKTGFKKKSELKGYCEGGNIGVDCCGFTSNYLWHGVLGKRWDVDVTEKDPAASFWIPSQIAAGKAIKTMQDVWDHRGQCMLFATANESGGVIPNGGKGAHVMITEPNSSSNPVMHMQGSITVPDKKGKETMTWQGQQIPVTTKYRHDRAKDLDGEITLMVVESTGGLGLVASRYTIEDVNAKGVFTVKRGCKSGRLQVRIATLGV